MYERMTEIDLQPALTGPTLRLRPLREDDFDALHQAASDPKIWEQHPDSERYKRDLFRERYFLGALESHGALAIVDNARNRVIGSSRYYDWDASTSQISIGYTFIEREYWGNGTNRELKDLMLNHVFQWVDIVWFHVGETNLRSRRAVEKLGAVLSHSEDRVLDDIPYTQLFYKLEASSFHI